MDGMIIIAKETMNDAIHLFGPISTQAQRIFFNLWFRGKLPRSLSWHYITHCRNIGLLFVVVRIVQKSSAVLQEKQRLTWLIIAFLQILNLISKEGYHKIYIT